VARQCVSVCGALEKMPSPVLCYGRSVLAETRHMACCGRPTPRVSRTKCTENALCSRQHRVHGKKRPCARFSATGEAFWLKLGAQPRTRPVHSGLPELSARKIARLPTAVVGGQNTPCTHALPRWLHRLTSNSAQRLLLTWTSFG